MFETHALAALRGELGRAVGASPSAHAALPDNTAIGNGVRGAAKGKCRHGLLIDWDERCITVDDTPIRLTPMEWSALERLARTPGEPVTQKALFRHLYGYDWHYRTQPTVVRVLIARLRRLLPGRIEERCGHNYLISGLAPQQPRARFGDRPGNGRTTPQPAVTEEPRARTALGSKAARRNLAPTRHELVG